MWGYDCSTVGGVGNAYGHEIRYMYMHVHVGKVLYLNVYIAVQCLCLPLEEWYSVPLAMPHSSYHIKQEGAVGWSGTAPPKALQLEHT